MSETSGPRVWHRRLSRGGARRDVPARLCWAALLGCAPLASAEITTTAFINGTTNYVYRAYTKSKDHPTLQANADVLHQRSGLLAGAWLSAVEFGDARVEAIPYAGKRWHIAPDWRLDTLLSAYVYDDEVFGDNADYLEAQGLLHYADIVSLRAGAAPDAYGRGSTLVNLQLDVRYPVARRFDVSASLGADQARAALEYDDVYWDLGLSWFPWRHVSADLRYHDARTFNGTGEDTGSSGHGRFEDLLIDPSLVFTVTIGF
jgi:uncharacterized protein (TIGR02001 family)